VLNQTNSIKRRAIFFWTALLQHRKELKEIKTLTKD